MKFHFHDWNKWSDPISTSYHNRKQQWKTCKVCNKATFRTLWFDEGSCVSNILEALRKAQEK